MLSPRLLFAVVLGCQLAYGAYAMDCSVGGFLISCPTMVNDKDEVFCCKSSLDSRLEVCCDIEDYLKQNTGILAGILVAVLLVVVVVTLCCCCFCSCCCLAKRRLNRGTVLYGPITSDQRVIPPMSPTSFSPYPLVHSPPSVYPPAYQPPTNPNFNNAYPPAQPIYKP